MTNAATIRQKLVETGSYTPANNPVWKLQATTERLDDIGGRFTELRFSRVGDTTTDDLPNRAQQIANCVTGLLEPLRLIEVDGDQRVAQLRSAKPLQSDSGRQYDEMLVQPDQMNFKRYHVNPEQGREAIPFTLTYEALAKFVDDVTKS